MNTIDSAFMKKQAFQRDGIYFDHVDTLRVEKPICQYL
jgi:hypothetical protein